MLHVLHVLAAALLLVLTCGAATVALLPREWRRLVLPGLPAMGAVSLAIGLHMTSLLTGVQIGVWVVVAAALVILIWRRREIWDSVRSTETLWAGTALAAGGVAMLLVIGPAVTSGGRVVNVTAVHDSFSYVTVADWLTRHSALDIPRPGGPGWAPGWGYVYEHLSFGLRIGDSLDLSAVSVLSGTSTDQAWYATTAFWVLLMPGGVMLFLRLLGCRAWLALLGGGLVGIAAVENYAVFNSNSDAMLGAVVAPVATALILRAVDLDRDTRTPLWLAGWAVAGLIGIYTELYPVLVAIAGTYWLLLGPHRWRGAMARWIPMLGIAAVISPLAIWNAVHSVVLTARASAPGIGSPFLDTPPAWAVNRVLGISPMWYPSHLSLTTVVLGLLVVSGLALGALTTRWRAYTAIVVGVVAPIIALSTIDRFPYGQARLVQIAAPLLLGAAIGGYEGVSRLHVPRIPRRALIAGIALAGVAGGVVFARDNVRTAAYWRGYPGVSQRVVGPEFDEAAAWLQAHAGSDGEQGMLLAGDFFDQLWMLYETRNLPQLEIPFVYPDYTNVSAFSGNLRALRRYAVVERDDLTFAAPGVVVGGNSRFVFLDVSRGDFLVTVPALGSLGIDAAEDALDGFWAGDNAFVVFVHSPGVSSVRLLLQANPRLAPLGVSIQSEKGAAISEVSLPATGTEVALALDDPIEIVVLHNRAPAVPLGSDDPRVAALRVARVNAG